MAVGLYTGVSSVAVSGCVVGAVAESGMSGHGSVEAVAKSKIVGWAVGSSRVVTSSGGGFGSAKDDVYVTNCAGTNGAASALSRCCCSVKGGMGCLPGAVSVGIFPSVGFMSSCASASFGLVPSEGSLVTDDVVCAGMFVGSVGARGEVCVAASATG